MNTEQFETLISLLRHLGIQVLLLGEDHGEIEQIDYGFRKKMLKAFDYKAIKEEIERYLEEGIYYSFQDNLKLHYILFRFPKEADPAPDGQVLCIGPVLFHPISQHDALMFLKKLEIPSHFQQDFLEYFNRIPLIPSMDMLHGIIVFFLTRCGFSLRFRQIDNETIRLFPSTDYRFSIPDQTDVALHTIAERYEWERKILDAVAAGDTHSALEAHYHFRQYKLAPRFSDPIRDQKNLILTLNTLLRKTVEKAHVHPIHIDNLSRQFSIQIEAAYTPELLDNLPPTMIRKYCMLVNNYSRRSYSALVRACMDHVDFHYNEELSLAGLADMNFVSPSYLSSQFKKETGMTVTDYINSTRIRQSLILLNASRLSIGEIASQCGFTDANYFTRTFKKQLGKTPKAYRDEVRA